jgi:phenylpropionate dioxygenase-like ring-hydroxylating dioxygenase large terminal subunit
MLTRDRRSNLQPDSTQTLPAGGSDPQKFDWKEVWYPVYYLKDLDKTKPNKFTLLEQDLVIWWDRQTTTWRAFADRCPHRLVPLSEGRITEDGLLECPYHGWAFKGSGECDRIPQQPDGKAAHASQRACATALPTVEQQGLLFIYPGQPENAARVAVPTLDPLAEADESWVCMDTFRDLPYDALTLLENVLDASHVPFTHHGTVGNRANAAPVELEVLESGKQGFEGFWQEGPRKGKLGSQSTTFIAPALMWHDLTSKQFGRTITAVYATPIRKGECRLFARFPFKFESKLPGLFIKLTPQWYSHIGQNNILEEDQIFLHLQERYLAAEGDRPFSQSCYLPTAADYYVSALRKWISDYEADPFPGQPLPPTPKMDVLLDRYDSHTIHCSSCRTALTKIQQIRKGSVIGGAIAWSSLVGWAIAMGQASLWVGVLAAIVPIVAGGIWLGLGKLERKFYEGRLVPVRNRQK